MKMTLDRSSAELKGERMLWVKVIRQAVIDEDYGWLKSNDCNYLLHALGTDWETMLNNVKSDFKNTIINEVSSFKLKDALWAKYLEGNSIAKIAHDTRLSYCHVHRLIGDLVRDSKKNSKEIYERMTKYVKSGLKEIVLKEVSDELNMSSVAAKYSLPRETVRNWVNSANYKQLKLQRKEALVNKLWEEYLECKDPIKVAENNGMSRTKFYNLVKGRIKR